MIAKVIRFVRLPLLLILIYGIGRFILGVAGVPYEPRGNAMFSMVGVTFISCIYFGALSVRIGGFSWKETLLIGVVLGLFSQILIFIATFISYAANLNTYFVHWDALNLQPGQTVSMKEGLTIRAGGLLGGSVLGLILASVGRLLSGLAPGREQELKARA